QEHEVHGHLFRADEKLSLLKPADVTWSTAMITCRSAISFRTGAPPNTGPRARAPTASGPIAASRSRPHRHVDDDLRLNQRELRRAADRPWTRRYSATRSWPPSTPTVVRSSGGPPQEQ